MLFNTSKSPSWSRAFNVTFHNRDDHAKDFSFLMDADGTRRLSPAYDLTYSPGPGGQHTTAILGEGKAPTRDHLLQLAETIGIPRKEASTILDEVESGRGFLRERLKELGVKDHPVQKLLGTR